MLPIEPIVFCHAIEIKGRGMLGTRDEGTESFRFHRPVIITRNNH